MVLRALCVLCVLSTTALTLAQEPGVQTIFMSRVFPDPGQLGLFIANADGTGERLLMTTPDLDYDPAWSRTGDWIAFTSERGGSADLYRVRPDGRDLERLTDSPAYDDQAAFSPDGRQLVFVTTRANGTADLWTLDIASRRAQPLTSGDGGDFRPAWSDADLAVRGSRHFRDVGTQATTSRPDLTDVPGRSSVHSSNQGADQQCDAACEVTALAGCV